MLHDSRLARFHLYHVGNNITNKSEHAEPNFQSCSLPPDLAGAEFQSFPWKERGQQSEIRLKEITLKMAIMLHID